MIEIGKKNKLVMVKNHDAGIFLDGGPYGEILLPNRYVPIDIKPEDEIEVFISFDSEDRIVATTDFPYGMVGDFVLLKVKQVTGFGAFLDWGLPKDLLVPFSEQTSKMQENESYLVYIYVDPKSNRIVASSKIHKFLTESETAYEVNDKVQLIISSKTDLGYKAIINKEKIGLIYKDEVFKKIKVGDELSGYIKKVREDGKIDLSLEPCGYEKIDGISGLILKKLEDADGHLPYNDKTDAEIIKQEFGISKKNFKKAIGTLYKSKKIVINERGIQLIN